MFITCIPTALHKAAARCERHNGDSGHNKTKLRLASTVVKQVTELFAARISNMFRMASMALRKCPCSCSVADLQIADEWPPEISAFRRQNSFTQQDCKQHQRMTKWFIQLMAQLPATGCAVKEIVATKHFTAKKTHTHKCFSQAHAYNLFLRQPSSQVTTESCLKYSQEKWLSNSNCERQLDVDLQTFVNSTLVTCKDGLPIYTLDIRY